MEALTEIQRRVFEFIADTLANGRSSPTPREISDKFGWSSKRAAECHIEALIRKGRLTSEPGKARSLRPVESFKTVRKTVVEIPLFGSIPAGFGCAPEHPHRVIVFQRREANGTTHLVNRQDSILDEVCDASN